MLLINFKGMGFLFSNYKDMDKEIPLESIVKTLIIQNKHFLNKIDELQKELNEQKSKNKRLQKQLTQKEQEFANYKNNSKQFYKGITQAQGFGNIIKELRETYKYKIYKYKKQRDDLLYNLSKIK